jgi:hypothetical protein
VDRERDLTSDMFNSLTKSQQDNILIEPFFLVDGKPFRFDFMSKSDYNLVTKLVNSINVGLEKQKNLTENIDTKLNNNENKNDIEDLRNTLLAEMLELKNSFTNTLKLTDKKLITVKEFEEMYSIAEETQRKLRGRLPKDDPLPCIQTAKRGNVLYDPNIVDKWVDNYRQNEG